MVEIRTIEFGSTAEDLHNDDIDSIVYAEASFGQTNSGPCLDSDGSGNANHLGILRDCVLDKELHPNGLNGKFDVSFSRNAPNLGTLLFVDTSIICALDLFAVVLTLYEMRITFQNIAVLLLIDNNAALCALIRGASPHPAAERYMATFWAVSAKYYISVWFGRVGGASNIADSHSRDLPPRHHVSLWEFFQNGGIPLFTD